MVDGYKRLWGFRSNKFSPERRQVKNLDWRFIPIFDCSHAFYQIKQVHGQLLRNGLGQNGFVIIKLLRVFAKMAVPLDSYPRTFFEQVNHRSPFIWTALIRGYAFQGRNSESFLLYNLMRREGMRPVTFTFSALIKACSTTKNLGLGKQLHAQTIALGGLAEDLYIGNNLLDMYVKCDSIGLALQLFHEMPVKDVISSTSLIVAYAKVGDMEGVTELFYSLPIKDTVAWTAMVTGFAQNSMPKQALELFDEMLAAGVRIDEITLVGAISASAQLGAPKYASWIRDIAEKSGFWPSNGIVIGSALIDMHSKCGNVEEAHNVFSSMREKNVYSYSSMISGFAVHGFPAAALKLFYEMLRMKIRPNQITFIGVLTACSHAGWVEEGRQLFASIELHHGVIPTADHYTCMVDLLGRAGNLTEALKLVKSMPIAPHAGVWGALLGACKIHVNTDIAEIAAAKLFELEPNCVGNYILLSNIYASARRWCDVRKIRTLMKIKHLKKNPSVSWIEVKKGEIYRFFAGDMNHSRSVDIRKILDHLLSKLKLIGYSPNLDSAVYDTSIDEKKHILMNHSEKLALGFGLLSTDAGSSIMIVKSLRICEDCHLFMCGASQITGRIIVIRDNIRFHQFRDGTCSCGGYW